MKNQNFETNGIFSGNNLTSQQSPGGKLRVINEGLFNSVEENIQSNSKSQTPTPSNDDEEEGNDNAPTTRMENTSKSNLEEDDESVEKLQNIVPWSPMTSVASVQPRLDSSQDQGEGNATIKDSDLAAVSSPNWTVPTQSKNQGSKSDLRGIFLKKNYLILIQFGEKVLCKHFEKLVKRTQELQNACVLAVAAYSLT